MSRQFQIAIKQIKDQAQQGNPFQYLIDEQNKQQDIQNNIETVKNSSMQGLREANNAIPDYQPPLIDTLKTNVQNGVQDFVGGVKWYGTHPDQLVNEVGNGLASGLSKLGTSKNELNIADINANSSFAPMAEFGQQQIADLQAQQDYRNANPVNTVPGMLGEQIPQIPLWTSGEGLVGKIAPKILPKFITENVASKIPNFITGGLKDAATYGAIVAPANAIANGDNAQQFLDRESQLPSVALGGMALRGAGSVLNSGLKAVSPELKLASELKPAELATDNNIQSLNNPLQDIKNAYQTPTQAEFKATLPPRQNGAYSFTTGEKRAMDEYNQGILTAQNYIGHNDVLAGYPPGTTIEQAYADVKANTGVDIPALADNLLKAQNAKVSLTPEELRMGRTAGVVPNLKPLEQPQSWTNESQIQARSQQFNPLNVPNKPTINPTEPLPNTNPINPTQPAQIPNSIQSEIPQSNIPQTQVKPVGAEPIIGNGLKERGFSANTRTDINNPDVLRDSYTQNPLTYEQLANKDTLAKAQTIFDQGQESAISQLTDLATRMQPEAIPLAKLLSRQATESGNIQGAREIISIVADKLTQAGQFGQAARILREADPETFLMTMNKQLKTLNEEGLKAYGKKWNNVDLTPDELNMVSKIERGNQQSYEDAFSQIQARIANELPSTVMEKLNAWRHISMLLNPKTQIRNVVGNGIMMGMRKSAQRVSGIMQQVALPQAERTQSIIVDKAYKDLANTYFEANKNDLLNGTNKYIDNIKLNMPNKRVFNNNVLEKVSKFNYDLLQWGDNPFYKNAYVDRLASYAQAKGIKDFSQLDQQAFDTAKLEAEQATYKDASIISSYLNKVKNPGNDASLGQKTTAFITEAALPFTKTPINIIKRGIQYSPVGIVNGLSKIKDSRGASFAIDEMAKGLTGTGILGLGYLLASKGILTGKASNDADLKAYNANTGNSPFSILGKFTYDWMQPFSVPLSVGVEIYNAIKNKPQDVAKMNNVVAKNDTSKLWEMGLTVANGIMEGLNASGDTVFNMSIMKGVKNLLGSGSKGFMEGLAQLPQSYATQFIPTAVSQLAGTIDPTVRQTYVKGNMPESFKNAIVAKIPVASMSLQPKQTPFGENVKKIENPVGRAFSQFLSPGIIANNQNVDPKIDSELRRLNDSGFTNQFPTIVPNYIDKTQTHPKITLTPAEATQYQKRVGELTLNSFNDVMGKNTYINAKDNKTKSADEIKADMLAKAITDAKAKAKSEIVKGKGLK